MLSNWPNSLQKIWHSNKNKIRWCRIFLVNCTFFIQNWSKKTFKFIKIISCGCHTWWRVPIENIKIRIKFIAFFPSTYKKANYEEIFIFHAITSHQWIILKWRIVSFKISSTTWLQTRIFIDPSTYLCGL